MMCRLAAAPVVLVAVGALAVLGAGSVNARDPAWTARYTADVGELFRILGTTGAPSSG
jgi:hypothetical protein